MFSQPLPWAGTVWRGWLSMVEGRQQKLKFITICFWRTPAPICVFEHFLKTKEKQLPNDYNLGNNGRCPLVCLSPPTCSSFLSPNGCCISLLHADFKRNAPGTGHVSRHMSTEHLCDPAPLIFTAMILYRQEKTFDLA